MKFWLMKSEPDVFSIDDLQKNITTEWEGVRNYQARNFMMNEMTINDPVLFYHSNAEPSGIAGLARVSREAKPDRTQFQKESEYFDPKANEDKPRWYCVEIKFVRKFKKFLSLSDLKTDPQFKEMLVIKSGQRLSIQPVSEDDFNRVLKRTN